MNDLARISDLFDIEYGNQLDRNKLTGDPKGINFVSRSSSNLGINGRVRKIPGAAPYAAGTITVTLGGTYLLSAFVQPDRFYTGQNIKVLKPKESMTFNEMVYYCLAFSTNRFRFTSHGREANKTFDNLLVPKLCALPEWVNDIAVNSPVKKSLVSDHMEWHVASWRPFKLGSLFEIKKGRRLTKANLGEGTVPFVAAIDSNNGYREFVDESPNHKGNTISVNYNGSVAEAFYQPLPFWASDDVNVLYPKFKMTAQSGLFVCTLIRMERYRFNYGRKWHLERMVDSRIRLPVTDSDEPDWEYAEQLIGSLPYSSSLLDKSV